MAWGGLFIVPKAFGDASMMIISEHCPRFSCLITLLITPPQGNRRQRHTNMARIFTLPHAAALHEQTEEHNLSRRRHSSQHNINNPVGCQFITKHILLFFFALFGSIAAHAELWTPVGEVDWTEGALTGQNSSWNQTWKVAVERSDDRPGVFRLQPYTGKNPLPGDANNYDNVYVYLHTESPNKIYIEDFSYLYMKYSYGSYYYNISQRCPENGYDVQYYGKIIDDKTIEFPINSFAVSDTNYPSKAAKYSKTIHKIVFPEGVLGYTPPQESWVSVGTGHYVDPFFTDNGNAFETDVEFYKNTLHKGVYKFTPVKAMSELLLHAENPDKVYLETYSAKNIEKNIFKFTQQCPENGSTLSQYGRLKDGIIEIPSEYFVIHNETESATLSPGRKSIITLPEGYSKPIGEDYGIYMGLVSFNDQLNSKPISLLNQETKTDFTDFVNNMQMSNATLLYYAVDQAITTMKSGTYPDNLTNAVLITFTDGLDQGSLAMAPEHRNSRTYAEYLSNRIANTNVQGRPLQAYSIGLKGDDVVDNEMFMLNLESLASDPEKAHSVSDINEVQEELDRLYEELSKQISKRVISITVPMMSHDDVYRFTFDHVTDNVSNSNLWFEGVFNIDDTSLDNVTYHGFTSSSGTKLKAEQNGIYLTFTIDDCRDTTNNPLNVEKEDIDQWMYIASRNAWQHNVENDKDGKINIEDVMSSSVIMFALDCSSSLGKLFPIVKETANLFINRLAGDNGTDVGIDRIIEQPEKSTDGRTKYYSIQGFEVTDPHHGIYIELKDGKRRKVYLK